MLKKSFTLIELLIVLVIVGIIAVLAIPQYQQWTIRVRGAEAMTNVRVLADSAWRYYLEAGNFPQVLPDPYPPPLDIDTKIPAQTKYFQYKYVYFVPPGPQGGVNISAYDQDALVNGPIGAIVEYRIMYLYDVPEYATDKGQKMDAHWYRYYAHGIKIAPMTTGGKNGWP